MSFSAYGSGHPYVGFYSSSMQEQENTLSTSRAGKRPVRALKRAASSLSGAGNLANVPVRRLKRAKNSVDPFPSNHELENPSHISMGNPQNTGSFPVTRPEQFDESLYSQEQGNTQLAHTEGGCFESETLKELWAILAKQSDKTLAQELTQLIGPLAMGDFAIEEAHGVALQGSSEPVTVSAEVYDSEKLHDDPALAENTYTGTNSIAVQTFDYNSAADSSHHNQYNARRAQTIPSSMAMFTEEVVPITATTPPVGTNYVYSNTPSQPMISRYSSLEGALVPVITEPPAVEDDLPIPNPQIDNSVLANRTTDVLNQPSSSVPQATISDPSQTSPDLAEATETDGNSTLCQPIMQEHIIYSEAILPFQLRRTRQTPLLLSLVKPRGAIWLIHCLNLGDKEVNVYVDAPYDVMSVVLALPVELMILEIRWPGYTDHVERLQISTGGSSSGIVIFKQELVRQIAVAYKRIGEV
ncbi:hypothetical protein HYPSUDRAFT_202631 [Hypholoma sublateritium FD-334 SS-4]|uniref:Uncharacterized protein n=1 Tax=Hypholoma sublateritium (strain FD-334 SS-4) TaxID=945553 RepID=A0A0D2NZN2_HYPSF|nr:hypothetical protein HYPSUDRAFT_202631 [Hypholoma sublateritium FD-334 SS-4]